MGLVEGRQQAALFQARLLGVQKFAGRALQTQEDMLDGAHLAQPAIFGRFGRFFRPVAGGQRFEEQCRRGDHLLSNGERRALIVLPESHQLAAGQRLAAEGVDQGPGVARIGARQRHQYPAGAPTRQPSGTHGFDRFVRQGLHERQAARHPARVAADGHRNAVLAELMGGLEFADQCGLFEVIELSGAVTGQQPKQGFARLAGPDLCIERVDRGPPGGLDALVAVDEHKARRTAGDHHDRQKLAMTHQRVGHLHKLPRTLDARVGIRQVQVGDLDRFYGDGRGHTPGVADPRAKVLRVISLQDWESVLKMSYPTGIN